jgi:uncharacterized UPF0160 family protein
MFHFLKTSAGALLSPVKSVTIFSAIPAARPDNLAIIGTHDGSFHCDEALAVSMLLLHPTYRGLSCVLRTRNPTLLSQAQVVVDVGAVYDHATHCYDHHQREFIGVLDGYNTRLSSAGLVYKHYGREIIQTILFQLQSPYADDAGFLDICYQRVYKDFIEHIDAIDNGISVSEGPPRYRVSSTLSDRVGRLNPAWNELQSPELINERFQEAMMLTCTEFVGHVYELATSWWPARSIVQDALDKRFEVDPSGRILIFSQVAPWKDHLFELEDQVCGLVTINAKVIYNLYN